MSHLADSIRHYILIRNEHTFSKSSFLGSINQEDWDILSSIWSTNHYNSGQFLITAEDDNTDVFFVLRGTAKVTNYTATGREVSFAEIDAGNSFGEFSAIDNEPRSSSVVAAGDCFAARMSSHDFCALLRTHPELSFRLLTILISHLRKLSKRVIDFNAKSVNLRLQEALLELAEHHSHGKDSVLIERPPTQSELAAYIFSSREGVAREMGRLKKAGLLTRQKRNLQIPSIQKLREKISQSS